MAYDFSASDIQGSLLKIAGDRNVDVGALDPAKVQTCCAKCAQQMQQDAPAPSLMK